MNNDFEEPVMADGLSLEHFEQLTRLVALEEYSDIQGEAWSSEVMGGQEQVEQ